MRSSTLRAVLANTSKDWVSEFAPASQQKFLSYCVGWLSALGWQASIAGTAYVSSALILELVAFNNPSFVTQRWHATLVMIAISLFGTLFNTFGAKKLPLLEGLVLCLHIFGFFAIIIPLWVLAPKAPASQVFGQFSNFGGWSSTGAACIVGQLTATASLSGSDAPVHLSEEVCMEHSRRACQRLSYAGQKCVPCGPAHDARNYASQWRDGFRHDCYLCVCELENEHLSALADRIQCITDIEAVVDSTAVFPFVEVLYAGTGSKAAATVMAALPLILTTVTALNALAAASRQSWSLSRDGGLPFSGWFRRVVTIGTPIPLNAIMFSLTITVIISLINIGSSTAFNSITGLLTGATFFSYAVSIGCILLKRLRGQSLPEARWSLGRFGLPINLISLLFVVFSAIISFFPLFAEVTVQTMNWSVVMFSGVLLIAAADYLFRGRKKYAGPVVYINRD